MKKKKTLELTLARAANIERLDAKLANLKKKADDYRNFMRQNANETKKAASDRDQERLMFLAELIRETGYPIEKVGPIVGAAIEFKSELSNPDMQNKFAHYEDVYKSFIQDKQPNNEYAEEPQADDDEEELEELEELQDEDE